MDMTMEKWRVAILNTHPIQYFAPLYAHLHKDPRLDITALYMTNFSLRGGKDEGFGQAVTWDIDLLAGYRSVFLGKRAKTRVPGGFFSLFVPEVWGAIRSGRYDALILHGHNNLASLIALVAAKITGVQVFMHGETHLGLTRHGFKKRFRRPIMSVFYKLCDRFLAIGTANAAFYRSMNVPAYKIFLAPYCVDNARFFSVAEASRATRAQTRAKFGIPADMPAILYAAKFSLRKHPEMILEAAKRVRMMTDKPFSVVMCGAGELDERLKTFCHENNMGNVVFTGFVNQSALPGLYGACDIFVLPSEDEPWGLAVNEAMCAGLPIVLSREIGCAADLVEDGTNGFTPDARDIDGFAQALQKLVQDDELRQAQGRQSVERISHWGYREFQAGLIAALSGLKRTVG